MKTPIKGLMLAALALSVSGCVVRSRAVTTRYVTSTVCDPNYPCANTYYWDQWRGC